MTDSSDSRAAKRTRCSVAVAVGGQSESDAERNAYRVASHLCRSFSGLDFAVRPFAGQQRLVSLLVFFPTETADLSRLSDALTEAQAALAKEDRTMRLVDRVCDLAGGVERIVRAGGSDQALASLLVQSLPDLMADAPDEVIDQVFPVVTRLAPRVASLSRALSSASDGGAASIQ